MKRKYDVDAIVEKMLKHADKYPELKEYANGLKALDKNSRVDDKPKGSPETQLTKQPKVSKLVQNLMKEASSGDVVSILGG